MIVALDWSTGEILAKADYPASIGPLVQSGADLWALQTRPAELIRVDWRTLVAKGRPRRLSGGRALGLAVGGGYVWVTASDAGDVLRIDPTTRELTRRHVGGFPVGIAFAGGSVWFADRDRGFVVRLDPRTLRAIGDPVRMREPSVLRVAGRYLLAGSGDRGTVTRIAVGSGTKVGAPIRFAAPARDKPALGIASAGASIWVSSFAANTLTRIGPVEAVGVAPAVPVTVPQTSSAIAKLPRGGKVIAEIPVPSAGGLSVGEGAVWATSDTSDTKSELLRIDPERNKVSQRIPLHGGGGGEVAVGAGGVWVSHPSGNTVSRIDPGTNKVIATIRVGPRPGGIAISPGAVWVGNRGGPSVSRIDPVTNRVVTTIPIGPRGGSEWMMLTAAGGAVWAAVPNAHIVVRINPATNARAGVVKLEYGPCAFLASDGFTLWAAGGTCGDRVDGVDLWTRTVTETVEVHPVGVALAFGTLWVAVFGPGFGGSGSVDRIDQRTGHIVARLPLDGRVVRLVAGFGSIWVSDDGQIRRIRPDR